MKVSAEEFQRLVAGERPDRYDENGGSPCLLVAGIMIEPDDVRAWRQRQAEELEARWRINGVAPVTIARLVGEIVR